MAERQEEERYFVGAFHGRYAPVPFAHTFWVAVSVIALFAVMGLAFGILGAWITEPAWILDKWPYPTPAP